MLYGAAPPGLALYPLVGFKLAQLVLQLSLNAAPALTLVFNPDLVHLLLHPRVSPLPPRLVLVHLSLDTQSRLLVDQACLLALLPGGKLVVLPIQPPILVLQVPLRLICLGQLCG